MIEISIVIPAYNEYPHLSHINTIDRWMDANYPDRYEIIVVNDGSTDGWPNSSLMNLYLHYCPVRLVTIAHSGKAAAICTGAIEAKGQYVLVTDMDLSTPISEFTRLFSAIYFGNVVIGSRGLVRKHAPPARYVLSWGQVLLRQLLIGLPFHDTQCGFKLYERSALIQMITRLAVYSPANQRPQEGPCVSSGFDVELLLAARSLGYVVREVPVQWKHEPTRRVHIARDAWRGVLDLLRIWWAWRISPAFRRLAPNRQHSG